MGSRAMAIALNHASIHREKSIGHDVGLEAPPDVRVKRIAESSLQILVCDQTRNRQLHRRLVIAWDNQRVLTVTGDLAEQRDVATDHRQSETARLEYGAESPLVT